MMCLLAEQRRLVRREESIVDKYNKILNWAINRTNSFIPSDEVRSIQKREIYKEELNDHFVMILI